MSNWLASLGPITPVVVFLLAAAESALFLGFVIPGELAVILGGVAAGTGAVPLLVVIIAAIAGAIIGDSIGYRIGSRFGPSLRTRAPEGSNARRVDRATKFVARRGWWALVLARFAAVLRAVVPFAAGLGEMPYRRFLLGNAVGGIAWGATFTMVGYVAGANYPRIESWIRAGGLAVVVLTAVMGLIVWATRRVEQNQSQLAARFERLSHRRPVQAILEGLRRSGRPVRMLMIAAVAIVAGLWTFGGLLQDVIRSEEFFFFDASSMQYLSDGQIPALVSIARVLNNLTAEAWIAGAVALAAVLAVATGRRRIAAALATAVAGQWLIVESTAALVGRTPPSVTPLAMRFDYGFPSEHVALLTAVVICLAWPWTRPGWRSSVLRFGLAATLVAVSAAARVVLLVEYPSDVIAGAAVAVAWSALVCLAADPPRGDQAISPPGQQRGRLRSSTHPATEGNTDGRTT